MYRTQMGENVPIGTPLGCGNAVCHSCPMDFTYNDPGCRYLHEHGSIHTWEGSETIDDGVQMSKQKPMLLMSDMTQIVYLVTTYVDLGNGNFLAMVKVDFDEEFDKMARMKGLMK